MILRTALLRWLWVSLTVAIFGLPQIVTALSAGVDLIRARKLKPMVFVSEDMAKEFEGLSAPHDGVGDEADSVVMGLAPDMCNYEQLNRAFRLVRNGAPLIALYKGRYRQNAVGELDLGPGPFVAALEYACDVRAEVVGKPAPAHFNLALRRMYVPLPAMCSQSPLCSRYDDVSAVQGTASLAGSDGWRRCARRRPRRSGARHERRPAAHRQVPPRRRCQGAARRPQSDGGRGQHRRSSGLADSLCHTASRARHSSAAVVKRRGACWQRNSQALKADGGSPTPPACSKAAFATAKASASAASAVEASAYTRTTSSVPDGRTNARPCS